MTGIHLIHDYLLLVGSYRDWETLYRDWDEMARVKVGTILQFIMGNEKGGSGEKVVEKVEEAWGLVLD